MHDGCYGRNPDKSDLDDYKVKEKVVDKPIASTDIDRKYKIHAENPCSGSVHTEKDSVLFLAKDKGLLEAALPAYRKWYEENGSNPAHLESIDLLIGRVQKYQEEVAAKVPDTDLPCEIRRCVNGEGVE